MTAKIITVTSGKGGVGKTTLTVGLAQVIAASQQPVLIIDFDFLNRGLSELVGDRGELIPCSDLTLEIDNGISTTSSSFRLSKVSENTYCLLAPLIDISLIHQLENLSSESLLGKLSKILSLSIAHCNAQAVLIDCHGSADAISRTAVTMSQDTLVICAPEVITFFGTRQIMDSFLSDPKISNEHGPQFHLIFNRVGKGFSSSLLNLWSQQYFKHEFHGRNPIAIIPSEDAISIAASNELFPAQYAMYSTAVEKLRLAVASLFMTRAPQLVSSEAIFVNRYLRSFYMTKNVPFSGFLDSSIPIRTLVATLGSAATVLLIFVAFPILNKQFQILNDIKLQDIIATVAASYFIVLALIFWAILAYVTKSIIECDNEASGILNSKSNRQKIVRGLFCALCVLLGVLFLQALSQSPTNDIIAIQLFTSAMGLPPPLIEPMFKFFDYALTAICWASRIYLGIFLVVFGMRFIRTIIFRITSPESFLRFLLLGISVYFITR